MARNVRFPGLLNIMNCRVSYRYWHVNLAQNVRFPGLLNIMNCPVSYRYWHVNLAWNVRFLGLVNIMNCRVSYQRVNLARNVIFPGLVNITELPRFLLACKPGMKCQISWDGKHHWTAAFHTTWEMSQETSHFHKWILQWNLNPKFPIVIPNKKREGNFTFIPVPVGACQGHYDNVLNENML